MPVLEYCSTVWCSAADTHLKLMARVASGAGFPHTASIYGGILYAVQGQV